MSTATVDTGPLNHPVVSADQWLVRRKTLLAREKELTRLGMPEGTGVSGLESDQDGLFYAGGGKSGRIRAVRRPRRRSGR